MLLVICIVLAVITGIAIKEYLSIVQVKEDTFTYNTINEISMDGMDYFTNVEDLDLTSELSSIDGKGSYEIPVEIENKTYSLNIEVLYDLPTISCITYYVEDIDDIDSYIEVDSDHAYEIEFTYEPIYTNVVQENTKYYDVTVTVIDAYDSYTNDYIIVEVEDGDLFLDSRTKGDSLELRIEKIIDRYGLSDDQVAYGYQLAGTEDMITYNEDVWYRAASTYKLPLNMLMIDLQEEGSLDESNLIYLPECYEEGAGTLEADYTYYDVIDLEYLQYQSLHYSSNTASHIMYEAIGGFKTFKELASKYSDIDYVHDTTENMTCVSYLMDVLDYLYTNKDQYSYIYDVLSQTLQDRFGATYTNLVDVHKYGQYDVYTNDAGILYTSTPFYYVVLTKDCNEEIVSEIINEMVEYTIENCE